MDVTVPCTACSLVDPLVAPLELTPALFWGLKITSFGATTNCAQIHFFLPLLLVYFIFFLTHGLNCAVLRLNNGALLKITFLLHLIRLVCVFSTFFLHSGKAIFKQKFSFCLLISIPKWATATQSSRSEKAYPKRSKLQQSKFSHHLQVVSADTLGHTYIRPYFHCQC